MTRPMWVRFGQTLFASSLALALAACIEPSNPCDPNADPALQAAGTRLAGVVKDTDGLPVGGVVVSIAGRAETAVSATDGTFAFSDLPPAASYELVALAQPPAVGGRARTEALACQGALEDVELLVVVPPPSPEVEVVRASGDQRLLVAFAGVLDVDDATPDNGGGLYDAEALGAADAGDRLEADDVMTLCKSGVGDAAVTFRVQVRTPFGAWRDAVVTPYPWSNAPPAKDAGAMSWDALADDALYTDRLDDFCAAALCSQFHHLDDSLRDPSARCAEIVGARGEDNGAAIVEPLEPFASYHVRVLAERSVTEELQVRAQLPARVEGALASRTGQMSLVPSTLLPIANGDGSLLDARGSQVLAVLPTAGGRFAIVSEDEVLVLGDGADAMAEDARATFEGPYLALACDTETSSALTEEMWAEDGMRSMFGIVAAGAWARVIGTDANGASRVEKLYVGADRAAGMDGPTAMQEAANVLRPVMPFNVGNEALGAPVAFGYLLRDAAPANQAGLRPEDAYLMVYEHTLVLSEQRMNPPDGDPALALKGLTFDGLAFTGWADATERNPLTGAGVGAAFGGGCAIVSNDMGGNNAPTLYEPMEESLDDGTLLNSTRAAVCFDLASALGEEVRITDHETLAFGLGDTSSTLHVLTDAANDRVLAVRTADLLCEDCDGSPTTPLATILRDHAVPVGRDPGGMSRSALIDDCSNPLLPVLRPVLLVANRQSRDISVLTDVGGRLEESHIVPVPANVVGFVEDPIGPTCEDPFAWAIAEDGRLFPIDMRGVPSSPVCNDGPCVVAGLGRGIAGGIGRRPDGPLAERARVVVGGPGFVGEVGFFAPLAPAGDAYTGRDDMSEVSAEPVDP